MMMVSHRVAGKSIRIPGMHGFINSLREVDAMFYLMGCKAVIWICDYVDL